MEEITVIQKRKLLKSFLIFYEGEGNYQGEPTEDIIDDYLNSINN